jgi:hypothetical protein
MDGDLEQCRFVIGCELIAVFERDLSLTQFFICLPGPGFVMLRSDSLSCGSDLLKRHKVANVVIVDEANLSSSPSTTSSTTAAAPETPHRSAVKNHAAIGRY